MIFDPRCVLCQSLRSNGWNQGMFRAVFRTKSDPPAPQSSPTSPPIQPPRHPFPHYSLPAPPPSSPTPASGQNLHHIKRKYWIFHMPVLPRMSPRCLRALLFSPSPQPPLPTKVEPFAAALGKNWLDFDENRRESVHTW